MQSGTRSVMGKSKARARIEDAVRRVPVAWARAACLSAAVLASVLWPLATAAQAAPEQVVAPASPASAAAPLGRPRIGLVLSGGGARGLAHVGVLKVLEAARVPIDVIAGTSMGAIIGGLYASGMGADELERELLSIDWDKVFASRAARESLSLRRKEEDFEISPAIEIGLNRLDGSPTLPLGSVSSRGLELLLRRYTLPVRAVRNFDALPIPFRAVATDMETGAGVVFRDGDLAEALRASMSVPGVFPPSDVDGRILGDGGLVNNLPVDVARALGAEVIIAVNVGTPLAGRETLGSVLGITAQMINILTEQNVQRSLAALDPARDLLITPALGRLSSGDFARSRELMALGHQQAAALQDRLAALAVSPTEWAAWRERHDEPKARTIAPIASVRFEGTEVTHPERRQALLESQPGQPFSVAAAERDSRQLAASGDYLHADYRVEDMPGGTGLVFDLEEKPWGPNYFRLGLELSSDFNGRGSYNVKLSHNRHWLNAWGGEWRNQLQVGSTPRLATEWYQPLGIDRGSGSDWFVAAVASVERRLVTAYSDLTPLQSAKDASVVGRYGRGTLTLRADVGQPWGAFGELRLGLQQELLQIEPDFALTTSSGSSALAAVNVREQALRLSVVADQLDDASFARSGFRWRLTGLAGQRRAPVFTDGVLVDGASTRSNFRRVELDATRVQSWGAHTVDATLRLRAADSANTGSPGYYTLGGFHQLSGYAAEQLSGDRLFFTRLSYYRRLNQQPVLTRGFFAGATLEAGNTWSRSDSVHLSQLRLGGSVFLGADTGVGPLYLGLTYAPKGQGAGLYLLLGRP